MVEIFKDDQKGWKKDQADQLDTPDVRSSGHVIWEKGVNSRDFLRYQKILDRSDEKDG